MKFSAVLLLIACMLSGCSSEDVLLKQATDLRKTILEADSCTFQTVITADYGDRLYTFQMDCTADNTGNLQFVVTDPETICGITGTISHKSSALTFDDKVLAFPMLANDQLTPVSTPWIFINTLRSGYIVGCSKTDEEICILIDDSYEENPLHLEVYTDIHMTPIHTDIFWNQQRILSADIRNFTIQ